VGLDAARRQPLGDLDGGDASADDDGAAGAFRQRKNAGRIVQSVEGDDPWS